MNLTDLSNAIRAVLPEASIDMDNEGQLIIYTNLIITDDETLVSLDS